MSRRLAPLPDPLGTSAFSTRAALRVGVTRRRLRAADLVSPFTDVRVAERPTTVRELAEAYAPIGSPGEFFSHTTAAILHCMWLPLALEQELVLHVSVRKPLRAPRNAGVIGHHLVDRPGLVRSLHGMPVSNPFETWAQLARILSVTDLVVAGESLLQKSRSDRHRNLQRLPEVAADPARPFHRRLARAAVLLRIDSRSAGETRFRLVLTPNGLPEPSINVRIHGASGEFIGEGDLVYLEERTLVEYEGDGHRERKQFRKDISRVESFIAEGWRVIGVTADDEQEPTRALALIRSALGLDR